MEFGIVNEIVYKSFTVVDSEKNLITGLTQSDFTVDLFDPNGNDISGSVTVSITELDNGHYRASFTPTIAGEYFLAVYNATYFPYGKTGTIRVYSDNFDSLGYRQKLILGLVHENIFIDNTVFDSDNNLIKARIRIYSNSASVGTDNDILGTYRINANSSGPGKFTTWEQIKV